MSSKKSKGGRRISRAAPAPVPAAIVVSASPSRYRRLGLALISICASVGALKEFFYPMYVDYNDGKLGGELVLTVGSVPLNVDIPTYVLFPVGEASDGDRFMVPIGLALRNEAKTKASEVTLSTQFPKDARRPALEELLVRTHSGPHLLGDLANEVNSGTDFDYSVNRIKFLSPKEEFQLFEGAISQRIPPSVEPFEPLFFNAHQGVDIKVTASSERDEKASWEIRYRAVRTKRVEDISKVMQEFYAKQIALDLRERLSTGEYLRRLMFGEEVVVAAYGPDFGHITHLSLFVPKQNPKQYVYYKFDPYKFSLLFYSRTA